MSEQAQTGCLVILCYFFRKVNFGEIKRGPKPRLGNESPRNLEMHGCKLFRWLPEFDLNWPLFSLLDMVEGSAYRFVRFNWVSV